MADAQITIQADNFSDTDSALGDDTDDAVSSTASINSSIMRYREENGRTYHAYKDGKYLGPNDEREMDRLDLQHHLFALTFSSKLFVSPVDKETQMHRVLDVGTGTGIWAIDFGDEHPESEIIGIDLSPIQPTFLPPNVSFQVDDLEEPWTFTKKFDFIYSRMMTSSFADWPRFFEQALEHLNPGGFLELADICFPFTTDDNTFPEDSKLKQWSDLILEGSTQAGRPINSIKSAKVQMEAAGFVNVVEVPYMWPVNRWPKDKKFKELGMWTHENLAPSLEGFSLALFTRVMGWTKEEVEAYLVDVRKELKNPRIHAYLPVYVVYGQKPK